MSENWTQNGSKLSLGGFLGPLLEALGAMRVPRGAPMLKKDEKVTSITLGLGPHFGIFWVIFSNFVLLRSSFLGVFVFDHLGTRFSRFWGSFLSVFLMLFRLFFLDKYESPKCRLDPLFTIYKAHCHF